MPESQDYWIERYQRRDALWIHSGNETDPHAELTSGKHSDGFFNSTLVCEDAGLLRRGAGDLVAQLGEQGVRTVDIDRVVGPAMGAITLAHEVAARIESLFAYTEKEGDPPNRRMVFRKSKIQSGESVLPVEDVLTTGGSVELAISAIEQAGGTVLPYILVLVNRSGLTEVHGRTVISLINRNMPMWEPSVCPLCSQGSDAFRPKENWNSLTGKA